MVISTHTAALESERRMLLRMLARDHPSEGMRQSPQKDFYRRASQYGLTQVDFDGAPDPQLFDDSHPYIHVDMSQCIVCYRCVRICEEVQGQFVWQVLNRGHETRIVPDSGTTLAREFLRQLRRLRRYVSDRRIRRQVDSRPWHTYSMDENDLPVLRHWLRAERRHER